MKELGFYGADSTREQRGRVEADLRECIDRGIPCSLLNMENQIITGYDDSGFLTAKPWSCVPDFPPERLEFGTWKEFGDSVHASFYTFSPVRPAGFRIAVAAGLRHADDVNLHPERHAGGAYGAGPAAYANWIAAVGKGNGASHGNWWNATVWAECRAMAAAFLKEVADALPEHAAAASELAAEYAKIGEALARAADRELPAGEKTALLADTARRDALCAQQAGQLADVLG
jgi:hypothetical protein